MISSLAGSTSARLAVATRLVRSQKLRSLVAYGVPPALGLLTAPLLAHALGPDGRGQLAAVLQPATLVLGLATFGFPSAVVYFIGSGQHAGYVLRLAVRQLLWPCLCVFVGLLGYGWFVADEVGISFAFIAAVWLVVPVAAMALVLRAYWQGLGDWRRLDLERATQPVVRLAGIALLVILAVDHAEPYVIASFVAMPIALLPLVIGAAAARQSGSGKRTLTARRLWSFSLAAWPTTALLYAGARLDQAIMPLASPAAQLGYYAVAVSFAEVPSMATALIVREGLHLVATGKSLVATLRALWPYWAALVGGCAILAVSAGWIIPRITTSEFAASVAPLRILTLSTLLSAIILFTVAYLEGSGRPWLGSIGPLVTVAGTGAAFALEWGHVSAMDAAWIAVSVQGAAAVLCIALTWMVARSRRSGAQ